MPRTLSVLQFCCSFLHCTLRWRSARMRRCKMCGRSERRADCACPPVERPHREGHIGCARCACGRRRGRWQATARAQEVSQCYPNGPSWEAIRTACDVSPSSCRGGGELARGLSTDDGVSGMLNGTRWECRDRIGHTMVMQAGPLMACAASSVIAQPLRKVCFLHGYARRMEGEQQPMHSCSGPKAGSKQG